MRKENTLFVGINYKFATKTVEKNALVLLSTMLTAWKQQFSATSKIEMTFTPDDVIKS